MAYTEALAGVRGRSVVEEEIERNPARAADPDAASRMVAAVEEARERGDSVGGIVACRIRGVPAGLGEPVFDKLDADLAKAMLSIGAVKAIEFGKGFGFAEMTGSEANDPMSNDPMSKEGFLSNNTGGILGGISTGQEIFFRIAVKPPSSISLPQKTVDIEGREREVRTEGRHDPCICPRAVPVVEAMAAIVLEDHFKRQAALHA